jgi:copper chaperone CopZ
MSSSSRTYAVTGMTCGHCVQAVTEELRAIPGVTDVAVDLDTTGPSTLTVAADDSVTDVAIAAALDEAGDYHLAP